MSDVSDMQLLLDYARQNSEAAFAELVRRHVNLVYSAALRHVGIATQAEEIAQAVFIILARKAGRLREGLILEAWLFETTRFTALSFLRGERRRQFREQEAYMQSTLRQSDSDPAWQELSPLLDEAMMRLARKEREAIVLRFFKERSLGEVAAALKIREPAAQMRVIRALEKLRSYFLKRGISSTTAIIAGAVSANSVHAAPAGLAKAVSAAALAKGAAASTSTLTLVKGALKIMAWTKTQTVVATAVGILLVAGVAALTVTKIQDHRTLPAGRQPDQLAKAKMADAKNLAICNILYAEHNRGQFPTNLDQIDAYTNRYPVSAIGDFQIVYQGSVKRIHKPADIIIIQGAQPWHIADGKWAKVYAFADGHAEVQARADNDFRVFELRHSLPPPAGTQ